MSIRERLLVRRLRERDERAFRDMVDEYGGGIFNLLHRMLGNREEAEDVAQEVFVTVFKSIDSFRGESKLSTWLYRVAANHCKNRLKYLGRRSYKSTDALDDASEAALHASPAVAPIPHVEGPERMLEGKQLEQLIEQGIALLDEEHRMLIVLRDVEELSYDEIATITGLPEGTVKSRLHRARLALKEHLAKHLS